MKPVKGLLGLKFWNTKIRYELKDVNKERETLEFKPPSEFTYIYAEPPFHAQCRTRDAKTFVTLSIELRNKRRQTCVVVRLEFCLQSLKST